MRFDLPFRQRLGRGSALDGLTPILALGLAACGGGGGGGSPPADTPRLSGDGDDPPPHNRHLFDGPIAGATVFVDMDNDGVADSDEPQFGPTGADGGFYLPDQYDNRQLIAVLDNARDADRPNEALEGQWFAEAGSEVISPLTHILVITDLSQADLRALAGITAEVDLTKYNPFDDATRNATDEAVIEAGEKVAAVLAEKPADIKAAVEKAFNPKPQEPPKPVDQRPTAFALSADALTLEEGDVSRRKLADIRITDDGLGTNTLRLTAGGDKFEIRGTELWLKAGALDYEAAQSHTATIALTATGEGATPEPISFTLNVTNVDEAPTAMRLSSSSASLEEGTTTAKKLADISFTDVDGGSNAVTADNARLFEIRNDTELWLKAGVSLDYETAADRSHTVTVSGPNSLRQTFTLTVSNDPADDPPPPPVDQRPTAFSLSADALTLEEGDVSRRKLADIEITDDGLGTNTPRLTAGSDRFEIRGTELWLKAGALDYETAQSHTATIALTASGEGATLRPIDFTLNVDDVDELPTAMRLSSSSASLVEGSTNIELAEITFTDDALGTNTASIPNSDIFEINGNKLRLKADAVLDYETAKTHTITITGTGGHTQDFTLNVDDVDEAPTAMRLSSSSASLAEGTTTAKKLAEITFTDDALGTNTASIPDSDIFEINGNKLRLKADAVLDYETATSHTITITGTGGHTADFTLTVTDADEAPTAMALSSASITLVEGTTTAKKLADISFTDDALGSNSVTIPKHRLFEIRNDTELWLKSGKKLNYDKDQSHTITITGTGGHTQDFTLAVREDVDDLPTAMDLSEYATSIVEGTIAERELAVISFDDADTKAEFLQNIATIIGTNPASDIFEINGNTLYLKADAVLDYETASSHIVTIGGPNNLRQTFTLTVSNDPADDPPPPPVENIPTEMRLSFEVVGLVEGATTAQKLSDISFTNAGGDIITVPLVATVATHSLFEIRNDTELWLRAGATLDHDASQSHRVTISGPNELTRVFELTVTDDARVTGFLISRTRADLREDTDTSTRIKLADIELVDKTRENQTIAATVGGITQTEFDGKTLYLRAGAVLDFEGPNNFNVTLSSGDIKAHFSLKITDDPSDNPPPALTLSSYSATADEGANAERKLADIILSETLSEEARASFTPSINFETSTPDIERRFEIRNGNELWVKENARFDFENDFKKFTIRIAGPDGGVQTFTLDINDVDESPPSMFLSSQSLTIDAGITMAQKLADVTFNDPDTTAAFRQNSATVADNNLFEIRNNTELWLKAGVSLDYDERSERSQIVTVWGSNGSKESFVLLLTPPTPATDPVTAKDPSSAPSGFSHRAHFLLHAKDVPDEHEPEGLAHSLILGSTWSKPDTGPLEISWYLDTSVNKNILDSDTKIAEAKAKLADVFSDFEKNADVAFTEITDPAKHDTAHFRIYFADVGDTSNASAPGDADRRIKFAGDSLESIPNVLITHELGHALGLSHPFQSAHGWSGAADLQMSDKTIMSYWLGWTIPKYKDQGLLEADIAALQFLYGAPGSNDAGPQQYLTVTQNHAYDALIQVPENILTTTPIYDLELEYMRPSDRYPAADPRDGPRTYTWQKGPDVFARDNKHFRIDSDGFIYFKESPDFENPHDTYGGGYYSHNNFYEIQGLVRYDGHAEPQPLDTLKPFSLVVEVTDVENPVATPDII